MTAKRADALHWREIFWPPVLRPDTTHALLQKWASDPRGPYIALEARSTQDGIRYLIGAHEEALPSVICDLERYVSGVITTSAEARRPSSVARRLRGNGGGSLRDGSHTSTRAILSSLSSVEPNEEVIVQVLLGLRFSPKLPPNRLPKIDQPLASQLLHGVADERRSGVIRDIADKQSQPAIDTVVRIGAVAVNAYRRQALIEGVMAAYQTLTTPTARLSVRPEKPHKLDAPQVRWRSLRSERRTPDEVAHLTAWPLDDDTAGAPPLPGQPPSHPRPLAPTATTPPSARVFGTTTAPGVAQLIGITELDSRQHLRVVGPTGVGKSNLLRALIRADRAAGTCTIIIEPKDLVAEILADTTPEQISRTVVVDAADSQPVGINPLATEGRDPDAVASHLFNVIDGLYDDLGPRSSHILRHAIQALAVRGDANLTHIPLLLTNPGVRRSLTQQVIRRDPVSAAPFWQWFDDLSPEMATQVTSPLSNKLGPLIAPTLRGVLGQTRPRVTIRRVIDEGLTLLVPLQVGRLGAANARLLGAVVLAEVWQAIREQVSVPAEERPTVSVYLDEFQDVIGGFGKDLVGALTQARSLGGAFHVAHQHNDQLPKSVRSAVEANCRSTVAFQLGHTDAATFARTDARLEAEDFTALPRFHFYAQLLQRGTVQPFVSGVTTAPVPDVSDPADVMAASRDRFGADRTAIDDECVALMGSPATSADGNIGGARRRRSS
ncbi:MAG: type IV secretory system conjugative DNA transfer family protein [Gordonia sp. (in: high G+C Gram-positive bacteria)]|uniref:type IV secretory system conjugative DNA transfer family protein n=1 Tax=Gordonia sp. (in: high G+C Gram-positive bacteria) TaxID=84139 RepID=UPI0039E6DC00